MRGTHTPQIEIQRIAHLCKLEFCGILKGTNQKQRGALRNLEEKKIKSVKLGEIIREFDLEILHKGTDYENVPLWTLDVNRPGLPLSGFFEHFDTQRLLLMGLTESSFVRDMTPEQRRESFERLLAYPVPGLIFTRGIDPTDECMEMARKYDRTVLRTQRQTSAFMSSLITSLGNHLAPQITRSGVMMEVHGEGVLLQGESGVGKSEVAIELLKRGHRLIADDAVDIKATSYGVLMASAPVLISQYMVAVKPKQQIELVIHLEPWDDHAAYDRLGLETHSEELLGIQVPSITIPVKPGRNLASIVEVAAMNNRNRKLGHNAALELTERMDRLFQEQQPE